MISDFLLTPAGRTTEESLRLDLWNAEARGHTVTDKGRLDWRAYVHHTEHIFVFIVKTTGDESAASLRVREQWGISPAFYLKKVDPLTMLDQLPPKPVTETRDDVTLVADANYALSSLHWGLRTLLDLDARFAFNDPLRPRWEETLRRILDMPADETGLMIGSDQRYDSSHRSPPSRRSTTSCSRAGATPSVFSPPCPPAGATSPRRARSSSAPSVRTAARSGCDCAASRARPCASRSPTCPPIPS